MSEAPIPGTTPHGQPHAGFSHSARASAGEQAQRWSELHPDQPIVSFHNVALSFGRNHVFEDISFQVHPGETRILLGPAGVGKSVLLKLVNGLLKPDSGEVCVFGQPIQNMREEELFPLRADIGTVFQEGALFDSMNVRDNVGYRLNEEHVAPEEVERRVREALRFVELEHTLEKYPSELSGGMRRRVSIARAIITGPELLLYDSPTGGLDPITSTTIIELVLKQRDVSGTSSLLVTHRLQDAFYLATHRWNQEKNAPEQLPDGQTVESTSFLVLHDRKLVFDGSTHDLVHSDDPFLKDYLS
jgi:phospholipid/cholesterol/gamma-HCH transport system ATP-binding protein